MKTTFMYASFCKKISIGLVLVVMTIQLNAQTITNYPFSTSVGTFTALTGATNPSLTGSTDEGYFNNIPIGFDFWFIGIRYTSISASSNGWIALGANITTATPINSLTNGGAPRPVIAALWDDLDIQAATNISYLATGTVGSRVFTIEYLNAKWQNTVTGNTISFQVKLYESTGKIEFVYRSESGLVQTPSASIGIAATATGSGSFLAVSNAGNSASSTFEASITAKPVTGRTYSFTPVAPIAPSSLTFPNVSTTSMTLNWVDNSSNESGFAIYRSTDGTNYSYVSQVAANAKSSSQTGLSAGTLYYWKVFAVAQGSLSTALIGNQSTVCTDAPTITLTATETCVGGSSGAITAVPTGGTGPFTYNINGGSYQSSATFTGLAAGNYTVNTKSASTCTSSSSITVVQFANSTDNQTLAGIDSWIGHVYDGVSFNSYLGSYNETENFNQFFGGSNTCFSIVSNALPRSIFSETFSIKYRMSSTKKGLYAVSLGSDDGNRLTVDGAMPFNSWLFQSFVLRPSVLINLTGSSSLLYEFFENSGTNQVMFQNLTLVLANNISTNTTQSICVGSIGSSISGDVYSTLPSGITLSGTGYQWSYSTTIGGARTNITGATAASFTPNTSAAPFNIPSTYYVYRNAVLSSANNVSPNPYAASNESNAATITINAAGLWSGDISSNWTDAGNWCTGTVPIATINVVIFSTATRMPIISSSVACNNLTINAGATLTTTVAGTLNIAGTLTNNGSIINSGTTNFNGTIGQQTFSGVSSFYNLTLTNSNGLLLPAAINVDNNLTITAGTLNVNNFNIALKGNWTNIVSTTAFTAGTGTVTFNGTTAQIIAGTFATTFNNLIVANTASTVTLNANASIVGDLSITNGIFDLSTFTANRASAGGTLTLANNATLKIGGTNTYPSNFTTNTLVVASTVEYAGTNQIVANQAYGNLVLSSSSAAAAKTFPATALTIVGNFSTTIGAGTSVSFTAASNITVNGNVAIGASTTFNGGSYVHIIGGNWTNNGTFTGSTSSILFAGASSTVGGSGTQNFNNLTVTGSLVSFSSGNININGNLATTGSGSFTQAISVTTTMTGAGTTISGSSISLNNLTVSGAVSTAASIEITGNLSVSGSFAASAGTITMSGSSKNISGAGSISFGSLSVQGSIVTAIDFSISSSLSISRSFSATSGTATFTGTSTLSGTANLFNTTINGTSLQLSANSILGIANTLTVTAGILNVSSSIPNTVNFNGPGAQNINAITYDNLTLSNGNNKSAISSITINSNLTIAIGTTFIGGAFTHYIYNDWTNNGNFTAGTGTIEFLGDQTTHIIGATTFNILNINNSNAATGVDLHNNISVATINMVLGELLTDSNTITITNTRTGNGFIYGNIHRSHAFTTGIAYAFESAENTINFSAISGVTDITVSVAEESIADFPFGGSISRVYSIAVPSGTYTAALRLHYEDDELNGSNESSMALWHYNGSSWASSGKTSNSTTANYVEQTGLTNITNRWTISDNSNVVRWNGNTSSDWNTATNWTVVQGSPATPPVATDIVNVGTASFTNQPTISNAVTVKNINFGSTQAVTLSMTVGGSLTVGDIDGTWSSNLTHTINANNQTITVNGDLALSDGTSNHNINLNIGTGNVNIGGYFTQSGNANIIFSGAGNLTIGKDYNYVNGTFASSTGTVTYNGSTNQVVGAVTYNNLVINKAVALASIENAVTINGNLTVTTGELNNSAVTTINGDINIGTGTIVTSSNMLHIGGNWNNAGSYVGTGAHVKFMGAGTQTISSTTFNTIEIVKPVGSSAVLTGNIIINGDLDIESGTLDIKTFECNRSVQGGTLTIGDSATFIVGANNSPLNFANGALANSSTVIADGVGPQYIFGESFGNLIFRNAGAKTLVSPITVNGNLTIENGSNFDAGSQTLVLNGNWINNGTFVPSTSTVLCNGTTKTITGNTSFNKATITGSYTLLNDVAFNGLLTITNAGAFYAGAPITVTMNSDLINNGILYTLGTTTFTGNVQQTLSLINAVQTVAITVNFNGSVSPILNSTSAPQYGFLNINNTGGVNPSVGWTIAYGLTVGTGASFNGGASSHIIAGYLTNNGTITSNGSLTFVPTSPATVNFGSNFTSTGNVNFAGAGAITIAGSPISLNNVNISNTNIAGISPSSDWPISNKLTVANGSSLNAGSHNYLIGGNILNNGIINSGSSTFIMGGSSSQDIYSSSAFNNLTINKAIGAITLSSNTTVNAALNFVAGTIQTGSYNLIQPSSGTVTGAAQNTGWVNGKLQKNIAAGNTSKAFEVGDSASYTPVAIVFESVTTSGNVTASTNIGDHTGIGSSAINASASANRIWTLKNNGAAFTNYTATFNFVASDIDAAAVTSDFIVGMYNGGSWIYPTVGTLTSTSTQATALTAFQDFQIGEPSVYIKVWDGGAGTYNWSDAANWNRDRVPTSIDEVNLSGTDTINIDMAATAKNLLLNNDSLLLTVQATKSLTVSGNFTVTKGTFNTLTAFPTVAGTVDVSGGIIGFAANGTQIIPAYNYNSLVLDGGISKSLAGNTIISGSLKLSTTADKLSIGSHTLALNGTIDAVSAGYITGSSTSNINIGGTGELGSLLFDQSVADATNMLQDFTMNRTGNATLGNALRLTGVLTPTIGTLVSAGNLTLASTLANTARIAVGSSNGGYITGNVTVERYITALNNRAYRLITPSVNTTTSINANWQEGQANPNTSINMPSAKAAYGTHITGVGGSANGFDATITNQASLFFYNHANPSWDAVTSTLGTLNANTGYLLFVRGNRDNLNVLQSSSPSSNTTLRTTGTLPQGSQTFNGLLSNTGFSLVSNPYAAPILWDNTTGIYSTGSNATNFENYITIWDPNVGTRGGFITVTTDNITAGGTTNLTNEIQSGQAFFVQTKAGITSPSLGLLETNKSTNNNLNVFRNGTQTEILKTFLFFSNATGRHTADGVTSMFNNNYSTAVDGNDAMQIANWDEDVAISRDAKSLSIEQRPLIDNNDTIQLTIARFKVQAYEWAFQPNYFNAPGLQAFLQDNFTNTNTAINLSSNTVVPFTVTSNTASAAANRFRIVFKQQGSLPVTFTSVKAHQKNQGIQVDWLVQNEVNMDYYEVEKSVDGIQFMKAAAVTSTNNPTINNYTWFDANPFNAINYYRIKSIEKSGKQNYSQVVKVSVGKASIGISVYPNPVSGNSFNLQFNNIPQGNYSIAITNNMGQELFRKIVSHNGVSAVQTIELNNKISAGIYQLTLIGDDIELQLRLVKQ